MNKLFLCNFMFYWLNGIDLTILSNKLISKHDPHCPLTQNGIIWNSFFIRNFIFRFHSQEIECKPYKNIANMCVMTMKVNSSANEGFYRQLSKYYYFTIRGENIFGTSENKLQLDHYNFGKIHWL